MRRLDWAGTHWSVSPHVPLGRVRHAVWEFLSRAGVDDECAQRALVAGDELVVNARDHVGGRIVVSVCVTPARARVAVTDSSAVRPPVAPPDIPEGGGLSLVWQVSQMLSVHRAGDGKVVAAELARTGPGRPDVPDSEAAGTGPEPPRDR